MPRSLLWDSQACLSRFAEPTLKVMQDWVDRQLKINAVVALMLGGIVWYTFFSTPSILESLDWENYYRANFHFLFDCLRQGEWPWWNPYVGLGRPFASDLQNAIWYPGTYLLLLGETPGLFLLIWVHLLIASIGVQRVAIEFGADFRWAVPAGIVFALSGSVGMRLLPGQVFYVFGLCYLPWILLQCHRLPQSPSLRPVILLATLQALQFFSGHPQAAWITIVGTVTYLMLTMGWSWYSGSSARPWMPLFKYAAAMSVCALVTAVAWLPMLDLIEHGNRPASSLAYSSFGKIEWQHVFGWFTRPPMDFPLNWEMNSFVGFAWTIPCLAGVFLLRDVAQRVLLIMAFLMFCFAFGENSIVFHLLFKLVPGAGNFRLPARMLVWPTLVAVIITAVVLSHRPKGSYPWLLICGMAGGGLICLLMKYPHALAGGGELGITKPMISLFASIGAMCLIWRFNKGGFPATPALGFLLALTVAEFGTAINHYRQVYAVGVYVGKKTDPAEVHRVVNAVAAYQSQASEPTPPRASLPSRIIPANHAMIHRYCSIDAYTSLFLKRPWDALHTLTDTPSPVFRNSGLSTAFFANRPLDLPTVSLDFGVLPGGNDFLIQTNPLPRAWFSTTAQAVNGPAEALSLIHAGFPYLHCPLLEKGAMREPRVPPDAGFNRAKITKFKSSEIIVQVDAEAAGHLVLNEAWFPGWTAEFDGRIVSTEPVNAWMRGVPVPAGRHEVTFRFRPRLWTVASLLSICGIGLLLVASLTQRSRQ